MLTFVILLAAAVTPPNVVFLSVDTLRADHLGCYGYERATSPSIDKLAEKSLLFEDFVCEVPLTNPSFGAMMTSRPPRIIGAYRNGMPINPEVVTVAERFRDAGYQTFCTQSNWTLKADLSGLAKGFDQYEDSFDSRRWGLFISERYADDVTRIALKQLRNRDPDRPFFAWFHYSDPHAPYRFHRRHNPWGAVPRKLNRNEGVRARYDSEVAYTDHEISRLLEALPQENTYVVFVADHGESLYEHDYLGHGRRIDQTCMHIPLLISGPGITPGRNAAPVRGLDIAPTLLGLAGIPRHDGMDGLDLLRDPLPSDRVRVFETYGGAVPDIPGVREMMEEQPPLWQGVIQDGWKLTTDGEKVELYFLPEDPMEGHDLASEHPELAQSLRERIDSWSGALPRVNAEPHELSEEDVRALEAGGYL